MIATPGDLTPQLATAPVTWGVWERTVGRDDLISPDELLGYASTVGYRAIELGPLGYFNGALERHSFDLVGAFIPLHLTDEIAFRFDLVDLDRTVSLLAESRVAAVALLADAGSDERWRAAGRPTELRRTALTGARLSGALDRLEEAALLCLEQSVTAAIHPEAASYFEAPEEINRALERIDPDVLGVCLDPGHVLIGGGDPVEVATDWADRTCHVHVKDVDGALLDELRAGRSSIEALWARGLFTTFGEGEVDLAEILAMQHVRSGANWIVLEQDRIAVRAGDLAAVTADERHNRDFVVSHMAGD